VRARVIESDGTDPVASFQPALLSSPPSPVSVSLVRRWRREPIVHFLLIGLALFAAHRVWQQGPDVGTVSRRIELTEDDLRQMTVAWLAQGRPPVTQEQMRSLVEQRIREEILYREALALGLDKADTIVKRRLAQKMEFLAEDVSSLREPSADELRAWFGQHSARFALSPRLTLRHLYFSTDRRGGRARDRARSRHPGLRRQALPDPVALDGANARCR